LVDKKQKIEIRYAQDSMMKSSMINRAQIDFWTCRFKTAQ